MSNALLSHWDLGSNLSILHLGTHLRQTLVKLKFRYKAPVGEEAHLCNDSWHLDRCHIRVREGWLYFKWPQKLCHSGFTRPINLTGQSNTELWWLLVNMRRRNKLTEVICFLPEWFQSLGTRDREMWDAGELINFDFVRCAIWYLISGLSVSPKWYLR